ncbi:Phosphate-specific transport system accessory protein PhoU [Nymphon striatum]|nr:Phosphate-specific transport system accessory protein PhoU [Nymphon striatum]
MTSQHILKPFDKDLQSVRQKIWGMAVMVKQELSDSLNAFEHRDQDEALDAVAADILINDSERIIDNLVVSTIVLHQPMASDCRQLIAALRISNDLERIGDYSTNIANHSSTLNQLKITGEEPRILDMGKATLKLMENLITAYENQDADAAEKIRQQDEDIDNQYTQIFADLISINKKNPELASVCTHLVLIARSLERIGDHITDIAEEILFVVNGTFPEDDRIKADGSAFVKG